MPNKFVYADMTKPKTPIYCAECGRKNKLLTQITMDEAMKMFKDPKIQLTCVGCQKPI